MIPIRKLLGPAAVVAVLSACDNEPASDVLAITNAHLYPVTSPPIENGTLLAGDGKILELGNVPVPPGATVSR